MHHVDLGSITIGKGSHPGEIEAEFCVMEWLSLFADEAKPGKQTDHPKCASPVLAAFAIAFNDRLDDTERQRLVPFIPRLVGTSGNKKLDRMRGWMATDWLARVHAPAFLRLTPSLVEHADTLAALPPLTSGATARKAQPALSAALSAAYSAALSAAYSAALSAALSAAYSAARSAALSAADSAARSAARSAAYSAARSAALSAADSAARSAARSAALSAAYSAARSAAYSAARSAAYSAALSALAPTVKELNESAFALFDRLIDAGGSVLSTKEKEG